MLAVPIECLIVYLTLQANPEIDVCYGSLLKLQRFGHPDEGYCSSLKFVLTKTSPWQRAKQFHV